MAAKKQTKSKTRTTTKKQGFQLRWWMAAALVVVVALVGILVLRYSRASNIDPGGYTGAVYGGKYLRYDGQYNHYQFGYYPDTRFTPLGNNIYVTKDISPTTCWEITPNSKGSLEVTFREIYLALCSG